MFQIVFHALVKIVKAHLNSVIVRPLLIMNNPLFMNIDHHRNADQ